MNEEHPKNSGSSDGSSGGNIWLVLFAVVAAIMLRIFVREYRETFAISRNGTSVRKMAEGRDSSTSASPVESTVAGEADVQEDLDSDLAESSDASERAPAASAEGAISEGSQEPDQEKIDENQDSSRVAKIVVTRVE